jgi:hypothetical protein
MKGTENRQSVFIASKPNWNPSASLCDFTFWTPYALSHMSILSKYPHQEFEDEKSNYSLPIQNHTTS